MPSPSHNLVSAALTKYRQANDLPVAVLKSRLGVSAAQIRELELGRRLPTLPTLKKLARFFNWRAEQIGKFVLAANGVPCGPAPAKTARNDAI